MPIHLQADIPADIVASSICVNDNLFIHPGADNSLVVWNMDTQKELGQLVGHDQQIRAVAARGNLEGKVLLGSASSTGPIKLWDVAASAPVALPNLEGHTGAIFSINASASTALSGSSDRTVRLWDLRTGKCVRTMEGHTDNVCSVDMDGDFRSAVSGSKDKTVRLWDLGSGRCSATLAGHSVTVRDVVMHESGSSFLSSGFTDLTVNAWAVGSSKASMRADLKAHNMHGTGGSRFFSSRDLSSVAYCDINTGTHKLELRLWK